ncbi:MAG: hypothetical protein HY862_07080 [Chloroflexi bacterium]|nr:hypothetical protein [Chloroflexota bacterium]
MPKTTRRSAAPNPAYQAGWRAAFHTACAKGHTGFNPSTTDRLDWGYDWPSFMRGWAAGKTDYWKL